MNLHILQQYPSHKLKSSHLMLDDAEPRFVPTANGPTTLALDDVSPTLKVVSRPHSVSTSLLKGNCINEAEFSHVYDSIPRQSNFHISTTNDHIQTSLASKRTREYSEPREHTTVSTQNRPSLFLNNSNQAAFTVGPGSFDSGAELSDLSEDGSDYKSEPDSLEYIERDPCVEVQSSQGQKVSIQQGKSNGKNMCKNQSHKDAQPHTQNQEHHHTHQPHQNLQQNYESSHRKLPQHHQTLYKNSSASESSNSSSQVLEDGTNKLFYILNSPSPTDKALAEIYPGKRQDLLFTSSKDALTTRADLASSVSSFEVSEDEDGLDAEIAAEMKNVSVSEVLESGSKNFAGSKLDKSVRSIKSTDTESEWVSVSSDGDPSEPSPIPPPLSFSKRAPGQTSPKTKIGSIRENRATEGPVEFSAPRSLLSGLFLNEMANISGANTLRSEKDNNEPLISPASDIVSQENQGLQQKPVLKRSSTTGIITVDRNANKKSLQRPSIILSKRYGSLSDISRNLHTYRLPVLYVGEEDVIKEGDSGVAVDDNQFTKQLSSVGLSDFMVVANSSLDSSVLQSHVDNGQEMYRIVRQQPSISESRLSSSLSKFSTIHLTTGASLKNLLSKSSLSLSSLFGQPKTSAKPRLEVRSGSSDTVRSASTIKSPEKLDEHSNSPQEGGILKYQELSPKVQAVSPKEQGWSRGIKISAFPKRNFQPSVSISNSLKDSLMIDYKLGKIPLPEKVISEDDLFHGQDLNSLIQDSDDYHSKGW